MPESQIPAPVVEAPPAPPTALEQAVAPPSINLRALEKLTSGEIEAPVVAAPPTIAAPAGDRTRDVQGRFVAQASAPAVVAPVVPPVVPVEPVAVVAAAPPEPSDGVKALQKRLGQERAKRGEIERTLLARLDRLEAQFVARPAPTTVPASSPASVFPDYETWLTTHPTDSYETYFEARLDARLAPKFTEQLTAQQARLDAAAITRAQENALQQIQTLGVSRHADFEAVQDAAEMGTKWARHIGEFMWRYSQVAPEQAVDLSYQLMKDPDLVERLNSLVPARAYFELGQLVAASPGTPTASGSVGSSVPVTRAPAPTVPVGTGANLAPSVADLMKGPQINLRRLEAGLAR